MSYSSVAVLRARLNISTSTEDGRLQTALDVASQEVDDYCGRTFLRVASPTARLFTGGGAVLDLGPRNEIGTATGLVIAEDTDDDGVYETVVPATAWQLEPLTPPLTGWPWTSIRRVDGDIWETSSYGRASVQVTARWGWAAVPAQVVEAAELIAAELWKLKDAPLGVAGFGEFGPVRVRDNPVVARLLHRYRHVDQFLGVG